MSKILWVQDELDGPKNGLVDYQGDSLWFSRIDIPPTISSTNIPVPLLTQESTLDVPSLPIVPIERFYSLHKLDTNTMQNVVENHTRYCKETGSPLLHGDPFIITKKSKSTVPLVPLPKSEPIDLTNPILRSMGNIKIYNHAFVPSDVVGEVIALISESEFTNYKVPRRCQIVYS